MPAQRTHWQPRPLKLADYACFACPFAECDPDSRACPRRQAERREKNKPTGDSNRG